MDSHISLEHTSFQKVLDMQQSKSEMHIVSFAERVVKCVHTMMLISPNGPCRAIKYLQTITKAYLYNFDPLKPHFYIVKLGFTGVDIIFAYFCSKT